MALLPLPTSSLSLKTVCDAYGVTSYDMNSLRGLTYYKDTNGTYSSLTIPMTPNDFSLSSLFGVFVNVHFAPVIPDQYTQNTGPGIQGEMGFTNAVCGLTNGRLSSLRLTLYINVANQGAGINAGYNSQNTVITAGGVQLYNSGNLGIQTIPFPNTYVGQLSISVFTNISGSLGQVSLQKTWTYNINLTSLDGPL